MSGLYFQRSARQDSLAVPPPGRTHRCGAGQRFPRPPLVLEDPPFSNYCPSHVQKSPESHVFLRLEVPFKHSFCGDDNMLVADISVLGLFSSLISKDERSKLLFGGSKTPKPLVIHSFHEFAGLRDISKGNFWFCVTKTGNRKQERVTI